MYNDCNLLITVYSVRTMRLDAIEIKQVNAKAREKRFRAEFEERLIQKKEENDFLVQSKSFFPLLNVRNRHLEYFQHYLIVALIKSHINNNIIKK